MNIITNEFLLRTASGTINFLNDSIVATLHTSGATFNTDTSNYNNTYELATGSGYTQLSKLITGKTITLDDVLNHSIYDCDNIEWTAMGGAIGPARYCALVDTQGSINKYIYIMDFGSDKQADDTTDFRIIINSSGLFRGYQGV